MTLALLPSSDPRCQLGDNVATITILSNDVASVISIADKTVTEEEAQALHASAMSLSGEEVDATIRERAAEIATTGHRLPRNNGLLSPWRTTPGVWQRRVRAGRGAPVRR